MALADWKTTAEIVHAVVTSMAVIAGGTWAYFRFVQGRTFKPRIEADVEATWLESRNAVGRLRIRVLLKNIGAGKVTINQRGTAVSVRRIADQQDQPPAAVKWDNFKREYRIFDKDVRGEVEPAHSWIEPDEAIADEILVQLPITPQIVQVRVRIVLRRLIGRNITVETRRIFTPCSEHDESEKPPLPTTAPAPSASGD
jgi:hypothetical protein